MKKNTSILVVDDDLRLRQLLKRYLSEQGFLVDAVEDTQKMDARLQREFYHLVVLDLMMPGENGLDACRRLRASNNLISIIMLTAKGEDVDRILGLELGADDYLTKPFNPRELLARINSVLRRQALSETNITPLSETKITFGGYLLDLKARRLCLVNDANKEVEFSSGLFELLKIFACRPNKPLSRSQLAMLLNDREYDGVDRAIDIQVSRLRKLIEVDPGNPKYIQTVWGVGYVFVPGE